MDPLSIAMLAILGVLIFFMFRNSRKRKAQMEELRGQMLPGVEVMTNFGLYGTLIANDTVANSAEIEISKGVIIKVHSQTLAKVVVDEVAEEGAPRSVEEAMEIANREAAERDTSGGTSASSSVPEYGEVSDSTTAESSKTKKASE